MKKIIFLLLLSGQLYGMDEDLDRTNRILDDLSDSEEEEREKKTCIKQADFEASKNELVEANPPLQTMLTYMPKEEVIITWAKQNGWYHE